MQCDCLSYRSNDLNHVICADAEQRPTKRLRQPTIAESLADKRALDTVVAEFFYAHGIPLHLVRQL